MKKIFKYLSLIIIFLITSNVYAIDECSTKEMNRLKELANNVKFTYSYIVLSSIPASARASLRSTQVPHLPQ